MGIYIELPKEWAKWSFDVRDIHDNILEAKVTDLDLVRCGECVHYYDGLCEHPVADGTLGTDPTDFCSYRERRANEID